VASGLANYDTLSFVFKCYDFDGSNELTIDEVTLAMKSTLTGLCKLSGTVPPREAELEMQAMDAFLQSGKDEKGGDKINMVDVLRYCTENPECRSWMEFYDDPDEIGVSKQEVLETEIDHSKECQFALRSAHATSAANSDTFSFDNNAALTAQLDSPWVKTIESLIPTQYVNERIPASAPDSKLEIEWVHGYRAEDCKNNVRYSSSGEICYHAAQINIIYNSIDHKQRYNLDHTDDIVSFAMHPEGNLIATGEAGERPKIVVWDVETMKAVCTIQGFHTQAVTQLSFNSTGSRLASVGQGKDNCLAIYDWQAGRRIFSSKICPSKTLDVAFGVGDVVAACGVDHIFFWAKEGRYFTKKRGLFGKKGKMQPQLSIVPCGNKMVSGTATGYLYVWAGRNCVKTIKAHHGSINALYYCENGLVSGGKDMKVRMWTLSLEKGATFDLSAFGNNASIRSVCLSSDATRILVGTKGCEIYEISAADGADVQGGPITVGHFSGTLCGLAVHPMKQEYCTVGDDKTVRVWDLVTKHLVKMTTLDTPARAVSYAPDGDFIVVGLGGDEETTGLSKKDGAFVILNEADLTIVYEAKDAKAAVLDAKFAPNGDALALSCADNFIYFYDTSEDYEQLGVAKRAKAPVTNFDFSDDSGWIQATCADGELMFFKNNGAFQSNLNAVKDTPWSSQNCPYGWPAFGSWSRHDDGSETLSCDRSESEAVFAAGDNQGRVRLLRYPCAAKAALSHDYRGHSARVSKVRFANSDSHCISIGADDRCVFQWRHTEDDMDDDADMVDEEESDDYALELLDGEELDRSEAFAAATDEMYDLQVSLMKGSNPDDSKALKPWAETVVPPSFKVPQNNNTPDSSLQLDYIYGYRSQDCRHNLKYTNKGEICYPAACVGVVLNKEGRSQKHNMHHTDEVICLAITPDRRYVATGQIGKRPSIVIWDSETAETVQVLTGFHKRAVSQLEFSSDGSLLASAGNDDNHSIAIYEWMSGKMICNSQGGLRKVLGLSFCPGEKLMQVGLKHIYFWQLDQGGRNMTFTKGIVGRKGKLQAFLSAAFLNTGGEFGTPNFLPVVGTADGHLYLFEDNELSKTIKAHEAFVNSLVATKTGLLISAARDGMCKLWRHADDELENTHSFDIRNCKGSLYTRLRAVDVDEDNNKILLGTQGSEIFEISLVDGTNINEDGPIMKGHYKNETWGLATHPSENVFSTLGDDGVVRLWDAMLYKQTKHLALDTGGRAICYNNSGELLAIGLGLPGRTKSGKKDGTFIVFHSGDLSQIHEGRDSQESIMDIKFSPDNKTLAVGSYDTNIYMYNVKDGYSKRAVVKCCQSWITHFDFTVDSQYVQMSDGGHSLLFAECTNGIQIPTPASLKDAQWATVTTPLGWAAQGFWPKNKKENVEITSCGKNKDSTQICTTDNYGRLRLWRYPCHREESGHISYRGHSYDAKNVAWGAHDGFVVSLGGRDRCLFQWKVLPPATADSGDEAGDSGDDSELEIDGGLGGASKQILDEEPVINNTEGVKPWFKAMVPPSSLEMENVEKPALEVELDYIHGFRIDDVRDTLRYNGQGEILYPAAAVGVIYRPSDHSQQHHFGHKNDIISLAVSSCGRFCATGDLGKDVSVRVWDALTGQLLTSLSEAHTRGVTKLCFSPDSKYLVSIGMDDNHTTCVYTTLNGEWNDGHRVSRECGDRAKVLFCCFAGEENFPLMIGSVKRAQFVTMEAGHTLNRRRGLFGYRKKIQPLLCGVVMRGNEKGGVVTGTATGHLYLWGKRDDGCMKVSRSVMGHNGACYSIGSAGLGVVTGGKDGYVFLWDGDLNKVKTFNMRDTGGAVAAPYSSVVHSVCTDDAFSKILVGCKGGEIYEIAKDSGRMILQNETHSCKSLYGISMHPRNKDIFATTGDDAMIKVWNISTRRVVRKMKLDCASRALCWSPDGKQICVGLGGDSTAMVKDGTFLILDSMKLETLHEDRKSKLWITEVKYSPSGDLVCMGSFDGRIYLHDSLKFELKCVTQKCPSPITGFDFDVSGAYLQATTMDSQLLFYTSGDGKAVNSNAKLRDTVWATQTCTLGWTVQGVWPKEGTKGGNDNVACVHRANKKKILVSGADSGAVSVYHFPTQIKEMGNVKAEGNSNYVSKVRFSADDGFVLTMAAHNRSIMQFKLNYKEAAVGDNSTIQKGTGAGAGAGDVSEEKKE